MTALDQKSRLLQETGFDRNDRSRICFLRGLMERHTYENLIAGKVLQERKQKYQF